MGLGKFEGARGWKNNGERESESAALEIKKEKDEVKVGLDREGGTFIISVKWRGVMRERERERRLWAE